MLRVHPKVLRRAPIASALFELRFDANVDGLGDLLPGMLYASLGARFPRIHKLPFSDLPQPIRQTIPDWQFQAATQLVSDDGEVAVNFGNRAIVVQYVRSYPGWQKFFETIAVVLNAVFALNVVSKVRRYSLRYQNMFDAAALPSLAELNLDVRIGDVKPAEVGFSVRGEFDYKGIRAVVQVATGVNFALTVLQQQHSYSGTLVDVDMMDLSPPDDFTARYELLLAEMHSKEKDVFFDLLQDAVVARLDPVWEVVDGQ